MAETEKEIDGCADSHRDCAGHSGPGHTVCSETEFSEYKNVVQDDVAGVHDDQRGHVQAGHVQCVPVTTEGKVHAHEHDRTQSPFEIGYAALDDCRIGIKKWKDRCGKLNEHD